MASGAQGMPNPFVKVRWEAYVGLHVLAIPVLLACLALVLEYGPGDFDLESAFFDSAVRSFRGRSSAWLEIMGHQYARALPFVAGAAALCGGLVSWLRPGGNRLAAVLLAAGIAMIAGPTIVNLLKTITAQHCPDQMSVLGGEIDYQAERAGSFFAASRQTAGRCLPSGHAAGGYALLSFYFAGWAVGRPGWRWAGLAIGIVCGVAFGLVRMVQGAHFPSATIWSAAIDWLVCCLIFMPLLCAYQKPARVDEHDR